MTHLELIAHRTPTLISTLLSLWEASVRATHQFLNDEQIADIKAFVPGAIAHVQYLVVAREDDEIVGFMGVEDRKLEMLFLHPTHRGKGIGRRFVTTALTQYDVNAVDVNEDNPDARGFYEHLGFRVTARSALDGQGNPFPILSMIHSSAAQETR